MSGRAFEFPPAPNEGSRTPPHSGKVCYGEDLRTLSNEDIWREGLTLRYVIDAYRDLNMGDKFFTPMFEKLIGVDWVRTMIKQGYSAAEIKERWAEDVERFKQQRRKYLLYNE